MLKKIVCFALLISILGSQSSKLFIYISFKINQEFIAKELCENKDVPKMNCNGNCYLAKQLKAEEEKEKEEQVPIEQRVKLDVLFIAEVQSSNDFFDTTFEAISLIDNIHFTPQKGYLSKVFQPPPNS